MTADGNDVYGWNAFSKLAWTATSGTPTCGTSGRCTVYDAFGRMVESSNGSAWKEYWYTQAGGKIVMNGTTLSYGRWPMPYGMAETVGTTNFDYLHKDWIGNSRIVSNIGNNTVIADQAYTPYGEIYNIFGANNAQYQVFADTIADLAPSTTTPIMWDTPNRELSYVGRWLSPDPAGFGWNQYAYPTNPNSFSDPSGLYRFNPGPYRPGGSGPGARYVPWGCSDLLGCEYGPNDSDDASYGEFGMDFGYTIWDALEGAAGTYVTTNIYGQTGFGFSEDLWMATNNIIDAEAQGVTTVATVLGIPVGTLTTQFFLSSTGWRTDVEDFGNYTIMSGILPDIASLNTLVSGDERISQAITNRVNPNIAGYILDSVDPNFQQFETGLQQLGNSLYSLMTGFSQTFTPFQNVLAPSVIIPSAPMPNLPPAPIQMPSPPSP